MAQPRPFKVCLCADDYAMTPGISRGIIEALDAGALTATSVMTTSGWWPDHSSALLPFKGRASIGLHLNLTSGAPLGPMPRLAPNGHLPGIGTLIAQSRAGRLPAEDIASEIGRQLDAFVRALGSPPDHVDGHQHVHVVQPVRQLMFEALRKRGWQPWLRDSGDTLSRIVRRRTEIRKALVVRLLSSNMKKDAETYGFRTNSGFSGFSSFDGNRSFETQVRSYLQAPGPHHLVMCHPGYVDDELKRLDPVVETREQELRFLTSPRFQTLLDRENATLASLTTMLP